MMLGKRRVLMVCLGNTCRSPIAEAVFKDRIEKKEFPLSWDVESAGLRGYHVGEGPNQRAIAILAKNGISNYHHVARTDNDVPCFQKVFEQCSASVESFLEQKNQQ